MRQEDGQSTEDDKDSKVLHCETTTKGNAIMASPFFRQNFTILDTQKIVLGPGDFLEYKHVHHYGSGIDVTQLASNFSQPLIRETNRPLNYFIIMEYMGLPCEITYNNTAVGGPSAFEAHIGTAPVILNMEIEKSVEYVIAEKSNINNNSGSFYESVHSRLFSSNSQPVEKYTRPAFNLPLSSWSGTANPAPNTYVIQVASDRTVRSEAHSVGNTNASDIVR